MADGTARAPWVWTMLYLLVAGLIIFGQLLPLQTVPRSFAMPDLLLALTLAWVARRPDAVPLLAVAAVFFLADLLFQRPPGLMTGLVLIGTEILRARAVSLRAATFPEEWLYAGLCMLAILTVNLAVMALALIPMAQLSLITGQALLTVAIYPVVVALSWALFGLRRPAPGAARKGLVT